MLDAKRCSRCLQTKSAAEFSPDKAAPSGLTSRCRACRREEALEWRRQNPEKSREHARRTREKHGHRYRQQNSARYAALSEAERSARARRTREAHLARKFGLTLDEFNALRAAQANCCAICSMPFTEAVRGDGAVAVDHDHRTGRVRGLLCFKCNAGIGYLRDSAVLLRMAASYLDMSQRPLLKPAGS